MPRQVSRRRLLFSALALAVLGLATACRKRAPQTDAGAQAARVVSLSPSTTETLFAIGAAPLVVGRSRYCNFPPEAQKLPEIGGYVDPSFEAILALRPNLVVGARGPAGIALRDKLEARGITTFLPSTETFEEIDAMVLGLGERLKKREEAEHIISDLHARLAAVEAAVAHAPRVRVVVVFGLAPLSVAGPSSFVDAMIQRAGGQNVVTSGGAYPTLGVERVIALDPDVVINAAVAEAHGQTRLGRDTPGWSHVRAVLENRVVAVSDERMLRPGPRIGDGVATLARAIHPSLVVP